MQNSVFRFKSWFALLGYRQTVHFTDKPLTERDFCFGTLRSTGQIIEILIPLYHTQYHVVKSFFVLFCPFAGQAVHLLDRRHF